MAPEHQCSYYLNFFKNPTYEFQKNVKKNPDVASSVSHKCVKYQFQIPNIMTYTKMKNVIKFGDSKICILTSKLLSFLCKTVYKVFEVDFLQICGIHH